MTNVGQVCMEWTAAFWCDFWHHHWRICVWRPKRLRRVMLDDSLRKERHYVKKRDRRIISVLHKSCCIEHKNEDWCTTARWHSRKANHDISTVTKDSNMRTCLDQSHTHTQTHTRTHTQTHTHTHHTHTHTHIHTHKTHVQTDAKKKKKRLLARTVRVPTTCNDVNHFWKECNELFAKLTDSRDYMWRHRWRMCEWSPNHLRMVILHASRKELHYVKKKKNYRMLSVSHSMAASNTIPKTNAIDLCRSFTPLIFAGPSIAARAAGLRFTSSVLPFAEQRTVPMGCATSRHSCITSLPAIATTGESQCFDCSFWHHTTCWK